MRLLNFKWIFITLLLAVFFHFAGLLIIPRVIFSLIKYNTEKNAGGKNKISFDEIAAPGNEKVVRMSPDMLYASMSYDVSQYPVRVTIYHTNLDNYWSVSLFEGETGTNIFALNDLIAKQNSKKDFYSVVIKSEATVYHKKDNEQVVNVKIPHGEMLYRMILPNRNNKTQVDALIQTQKKAFIEIIK